MNPYFIKEPAAISFSGGRTSAYMLYRIFEAHDGKLPDYVKVVFANTGKEMPETLDFVRDCGEHWGVDIAWVEARVRKGEEGENKHVYSTVVVDHETASRNGEPFSQLIDALGYLPNSINRFCTGKLKIQRIKDYLKSAGIPPRNVQYIGLRADEKRRAAKIHGHIIDGQECFCPLYVGGQTKSDVSAFWETQNFDLRLPNNNGTTDWGNCDLCFLKGAGKKLSIIEHRPDLADWWAEAERKVGDQFRRDQPSYAQMKIIATDQGNLFDFDDETIPCYCGE